jgi:hypothetical protein
VDEGPWLARHAPRRELGWRGGLDPPGKHRLVADRIDEAASLAASLDEPPCNHKADDDEDGGDHHDALSMHLDLLCAGGSSCIRSPALARMCELDRERDVSADVKGFPGGI